MRSSPLGNPAALRPDAEPRAVIERPGRNARGQTVALTAGRGGPFTPGSELVVEAKPRSSRLYVGLLDQLFDDVARQARTFLPIATPPQPGVATTT
jgi:hypothetical protein